MTASRFRFTRYLLSARSRGWDYSESHRYACDRLAADVAKGIRE